MTAATFSNPDTASPVTRYVDPTYGINFRSSSLKSWKAEVTISSSKLSPAKVTEVMSRPGMGSFWMIFPVLGSTQITWWPPYKAIQRCPFWSVVMPSASPTTSFFFKSKITLRLARKSIFKFIGLFYSYRGFCFLRQWVTFRLL